MSDFTIQVEGISKQYHIGKEWVRYRTIRESLLDAIASPVRRAGKLLRGQATGASDLDESFWALRDISFNIKHGEVVGIIGRNGAGKSTLLKILTRITEPTEGRARIRGRVGSLLEVGTGFHNELTGRENVYMNGAILGMKRMEIDRKFDEIVAFAEVEKFINTPVKHYSSGMVVRLAFAVAAHLDPEILLVDEVLAVGDSRFQKKCLSKMEDVGQQGRTVIFVSHNMPTITRLCKRTILLGEGRLLQDGPSPQVVGTYLQSSMGTTAAREWPNPTTAPGGAVARLCAVWAKDEDGRISEAMDIRRSISIEMEYEVLKPEYVLLPHFHFHNEEGITVFATVDLDPNWRRRPRPKGRYVSSVQIPGNMLAEGTLFVQPSLITLEPTVVQFTERDVIAFQVIDSIDGDSARGDWGGHLSGVVRPRLDWNTRFSPKEYHKIKI